VIETFTPARRQRVFCRPGSDGGKSTLKSSQDHNLAARFVLLHAAVRLDDVVELEHPADLDPQRAGGDLLDQFIEWCQHEILGPAIVGGQHTEVGITSIG
jgi:hypothetical protein